MKKDNQKPEIYRGELQERRPFDYPNHCLICTQELDLEKAEDYPGNRSYQISEVEMVDSIKKAHFKRVSSKCVTAGQVKFL